MFNYTKVEDSKIEFLDIAPTSELPNGERLFIEVEGKSLVVFNIADQYFAIGDICSHDDGPVGDGDIEGLNIVCPRHGGEFAIRDSVAPIRDRQGRITGSVLITADSLQAEAAGRLDVRCTPIADYR